MLMGNVVTQLIIVTQIECLRIVRTIGHLVLVEIILTVMITMKITVMIIGINLVQSYSITADYMTVTIQNRIRVDLTYTDLVTNIGADVSTVTENTWKFLNFRREKSDWVVFSEDGSPLSVLGKLEVSQAEVY